jgi:hypothetical protein
MKERGMDAPKMTLDDGREVYVLAIHPRMYVDLQLSPRERWKMTAREERMRRKGYAEKDIYPFT